MSGMSMIGKLILIEKRRRSYVARANDARRFWSLTSKINRLARAAASNITPEEGRSE